MREHECFVYIMCSDSGTLYIGMTNSIYRRALEHKRGEIEGFAATYHCTRLVYYESFDDVIKAIDREKQLSAGCEGRRIAFVTRRDPLTFVSGSRENTVTDSSARLKPSPFESKKV